MYKIYNIKKSSGETLPDIELEVGSIYDVPKKICKLNNISNKELRSLSIMVNDERVIINFEIMNGIIYIV